MKVSRHSCTVLRRVAKRYQWLWYTCAVDVSRCLKLYSFHSILFCLSNVGANVSRVDSYVLYLSSEIEDRNLLSRKHSSEGIMDLYSFAFLSTRVISRCSRATTARKCIKKRDARGSTCKVVVFLIRALLFNCCLCSRRRGCLKKVPETPRDYNYTWIILEVQIPHSGLFSTQMEFKDAVYTLNKFLVTKAVNLLKDFWRTSNVETWRGVFGLQSLWKGIKKTNKRDKHDTLECRHKPGKKAINFESVTLRGSASQRQKGKNWIIYLNPETFSRFS